MLHAHEVSRLTITKPEAASLRALATGTADATQQRLALACIRQKICFVDQSSFAGPDTHQSAFNEGKRAVGIEIRRVICAPLSEFQEVDHG